MSDGLNFDGGGLGMSYSGDFGYTPASYDLSPVNSYNFGGYEPQVLPSYDYTNYQPTDFRNIFAPSDSSIGFDLPYQTTMGIGDYGLQTSSTPTSSRLDKILGDTSGYDWAKLGIGGLGLLANYLANSNTQDLAEDRLKQEMALARQKMALEREAMNLGRDTDLAKVDAMMRLVKERQGVGALDPRRYAQIVASGQIPADVLASQGIVDIGEQRQMADGGYYADGGASRQGALSLLRGASGGQADDVNARLSHGEYVMDAESVSALGDGNTEAGARKLDQMRENIRKHKRSAPVDRIPPQAKDPMSYMKKGR